MQQPAAKAALAFLKTILITSNQQSPTPTKDSHKPQQFYSRNGEIPRHKRNRNANRLLHSEYPPPRGTGLGNSARDSLGFTSEPPREAQRILNLALSLRQRLARLVRDDARQVVPVLADQVVPSEQPARTGPRVLLAVALECSVRSVNSGVYVRRIVVWCAGPDVAGAGVCLWLAVGSFFLRKEPEGGFRRPMMLNLLPDLASTHSPLTYDLSWKTAGFLSWPAVSPELSILLLDA